MRRLSKVRRPMLEVQLKPLHQITMFCDLSVNLDQETMAILVMVQSTLRLIQDIF